MFDRRARNYEIEDRQSSNLALVAQLNELSSSFNKLKREMLMKRKGICGSSRTGGKEQILAVE